MKAPEVKKILIFVRLSSSGFVFRQLRYVYIRLIDLSILRETFKKKRQNGGFAVKNKSLIKQVLPNL